MLLPQSKVVEATSIRRRLPLAYQSCGLDVCVACRAKPMNSMLVPGPSDWAVANYISNTSSRTLKSILQIMMEPFNVVMPPTNHRGQNKIDVWQVVLHSLKCRLSKSCKCHTGTSNARPSYVTCYTLPQMPVERCVIGDHCPRLRQPCGFAADEPEMHITVVQK